MSKKKKTFGEGFGKNLQQVKDMVDGTYGRKIVSAAIQDDVHSNKEVGERYFDHDGKEWEKTEYGRTSVSTVQRGIADKCDDCKKYCIHKRDKIFYNKFGKCFYCQVNFETELQLYPIKYWAWQRLQKLRAWESIDKEAIQWFEEKEKLDNKKVWDRSVANALANSNVDFTIKKNTN